MTQSALNAPRLVSDTTEIVVTGGESAYRKHRKEIQEAERVYQAERHTMKASYEQRVQAQIDEGEDALRNLDTAYARRKAKLEKVLAAYATLRDV